MMTKLFNFPIIPKFLGITSPVLTKVSYFSTKRKVGNNYLFYLRKKAYINSNEFFSTELLYNFYKIEYLKNVLYSNLSQKEKNIFSRKVPSTRAFLGSSILNRRNIKYNSNIRTFSTKKQNNNSITFVNNYYSCFIPPITSIYDFDNPKYDSLITILNEIFNELSKNKDFKYKFTFKLFMHSNDKTKNLEFILGPSLYHENDLNNIEENKSRFFEDTLAQSMFYKEYKYHGYGEIHSLIIDFNGNLHNMVHIKKIIEIIGNLVKHVNEGDSNEFIEFKKWIILNIMRIPIKEEKHPIKLSHKGLIKNISSFIKGNSRSFSSISRYYSINQNSSSKQNLKNSNKDISINTLEFYKKLNGELKINEFDPNVFGSNGFYRVKNILSSDLEPYAKQELLEKTLKNLWENELNEFFKNMKSLNNKSISILVETLSILEKDIEDLFNNKKFLAKKEYIKPITIFKKEYYSYIISTCLSKVLPFIALNSDINDQQVVTLCEQIGKTLYKEVIIQKYEIYLENFKLDDSKKLSFKKFYENEYKYSYDDSIRLGYFLIDFISDKTDLYHIEKIRLETSAFKKRRILTPGKLFNELMDSFILFDSYEAPMIVQPVEWVIKKKLIINKLSNIANKEYSNFIEKYGGYLTNDKEDFELLIRKSKESTGDSIIINDKIVKMVNYMSSVPYKLNINMLNYIINLINENDINNKLLIDLHLTLHPETYKLDEYNKELSSMLSSIKSDNIKINELENIELMEDDLEIDTDESLLNSFNSSSTNSVTQEIKLSQEINPIEKLKHKIHEIISHNSKFYYNKCIITMGLLYKNIDKLYFPLKLDWRGRIYIKGGVLNIQGGELSRSLLLFSNSYPLNENGLESLKIYCANSFGKDKLSKIERIEWVDNNLDKIIDIDSKFWINADDKLIALATAFELKDYNNDPINFKSSLPILIDATCNGVQHLSAMIQDINLAEKVNLLKSSKEIKPNDLYSLMIEPIKSNIKELIKSEPEYSRLSEVNINRSLIKIPIMTISYNISVFGISKKLVKEQYRIVMYVDTGIYDKKLKRNKKMAIYQAIDTTNLGDVLLRYKDIYKLSKCIYDSLYISYPKLNELKDYFNAMADLLSLLNLPIIWVTPSGLHIEQKYIKFTTYDLVNNVLSRKKTITLRKPDKDINILKQKQSFIPNYVHSMDATNIILLYDAIKSLDQKIDLLTIHDCFGTHANDINTLSILVKNAFISIYKNDANLKKFHKINVDCIKSLVVDVKRNKFEWNGTEHTIPTLPKIQKMNLEEHLPKSLYFLN